MKDQELYVDVSVANSVSAIFTVSLRAGISVGRQERKEQPKNDIVKNVGSMIGSTDENVKVRARNDVTIIVSDLLANKDVLVLGGT